MTTTVLDGVGELAFRVEAVGVTLRAQKPDLLKERADAWRLVCLQRRIVITTSFLERVKTREEAEEKISALEHHVREAYIAEGLCLFVPTKVTSAGTEKAVKVVVDVVRGRTPGKTSSFYVPRSWLIRSGKGFLLPQWQVVQKLQEMKAAAGAKLASRVGGVPAQILWLPDANWHGFFASLRAQLPADFAELAAARADTTRFVEERARAHEQAMAEVRARTLQDRIAAARLAAEERARDEEERLAKEVARLARMETIAENAIVTGRDWKGPAKARYTEDWTITGAIVKRSGKRAYIFKSDRTLFCWKPIDKIEIVVEAANQTSQASDSVGAAAGHAS